jgi:hypothetical protein
VIPFDDMAGRRQAFTEIEARQSMTLIDRKGMQDYFATHFSFESGAELFMSALDLP